VFLVGREGLLAEVGTRLTARDDPGPRLVALCGLGGVGKTSVAVNYAYKNLAEVGMAWQFQVEDGTVLAAEFGELAAQLGVRDGADVRDPVLAVHAVLATSRKPWLLIFDNVTDMDSVSAFLPPAGPGRVPDAAGLGDGQHALAGGGGHAGAVAQCPRCRRQRHGRVAGDSGHVDLVRRCCDGRSWYKLEAFANFGRSPSLQASSGRSNVIGNVSDPDSCVRVPGIVEVSDVPAPRRRHEHLHKQAGPPLSGCWRRFADTSPRLPRKEHGASGNSWPCPGSRPTHQGQTPRELVSIMQQIRIRRQKPRSEPWWCWIDTRTPAGRVLPF
jgi:hypothetical protein